MSGDFTTPDALSGIVSQAVPTGVQPPTPWWVLLIDDAALIFPAAALLLWLTLRLRRTRRALNQAENTLRSIVQVTSPLVEQEFFHMLVQQLAHAFGARYALVGELGEPGNLTRLARETGQARHAAPAVHAVQAEQAARGGGKNDGDYLRVLAAWLGDAPGEPFDYALHGTPCARTLNSPDLCIYPDGVQETFPEAELHASLGIRSYMGLALRDARGTPLGVLAVFHDLPMSPPTGEGMALMRVLAGRATAELERLRAGRALRESEARYRGLFENNHVVALLIDPTTKAIRDASPAAAEFYGWPRDVLRTMHISDINTLPPGALRGELSSAARGERQRFRFRHRLANGTTRDVESNTGTLVLHGEPLLYSIITDVTEQHRAEEALRRSELRLRMLVESAGDAIYLVDGAGHVRDANPEAEHQTGHTREQLLRMTLFDIDERLDQRGFARLRAELESARKATFETTHRTRGGTSLPVEVRMALMEEKEEKEEQAETDGDPRLLAIVRDSSARKRAESELRCAKEVAEAASRTKSEFLANMSHEIRTPLNGIMGMLQLLQADPAKAMRKVYVGAATQSCRRLGLLLGDILDLSRIEAGKLELHDEPFEARAVLDEVRGLFEGPAAERGLALRLSVDERIPRHLRGDAMRLRQVLFNLVGNAVKFTDRGEVVVEAWRVQASRSRGCRVLFTVRDTGIGIAEDRLKDIFEPFVQAETASTRRYQGAGLGLPIVRRLVRLMRGTVTVESTPDAGTAFSVSLPFRFVNKVEEAMADPPAADALSLRGRTILLAEDDAVNRLAVTRLLENMGARVTTADNGERAVQALLAADYDCVLMDIQMPVMDGMEATRRLRALAHEGARDEAPGGAREEMGAARTPDAAGEAQAGESAPHAETAEPYAENDTRSGNLQDHPIDPRILRTRSATPIIALTAHAMRGDREQFLAAGMDGYLTKPVEAATLASAIVRAIREQGLREREPEGLH